jgi:AcrR family transcriptional regulator
MPRHEIADAQEKVLLATLEVAGGGIRGSFSTREIAERAGVSEFTVFSRYKTKEALIDACNDYLFEQFFKLNLKVVQEHTNDLEGIFNGIVDGLLSYPLYTRFAGNYTLAYPRAGSLDKYEVFVKKFTENWALLNPYIPFKDDKNTYDVFIYGVQEMIQDALFMISGEVSNTPANRKTMYLLFSKGLEKFLTIA